MSVLIVELTSKSYIFSACRHKVENVLADFGDVTNEMIRLKYKKDHPFAGLENGNRLMRMILTKPSIPYSLKIDGHWCCIIHNQQQCVCSNCHAVGHARRKCPKITCRVCDEKGHLSYDCPNEFQDGVDDDNQQHDDNTDVNNEGENPAMPPNTNENAQTPTRSSTTETAEAADAADITKETSRPETTKDTN